MSNIAAGTTSTTALVATADTTGALVFQTGASATTAMTISSTQTVSFTNLLNYYTASLGADVSLSNTSNFFDGPSVAQGTSGTWFVSGTVSVNDSTAGGVRLFVKIYDGTNVVASTEWMVSPSSGTASWASVALSGVIVSPAGNLRIAVRDITSTSGVISANPVGQGNNGSTITAIRIA